VQIGTATTRHAFHGDFKTLRWLRMLGRSRVGVAVLPHAECASRRLGPFHTSELRPLWDGSCPSPAWWTPHKRWWRAFMEYGNGITGDMCVHMFWRPAGLLPASVVTHIIARGIYVNKGKSNISDTQNAILGYGLEQ
jgi:predicted dehydrogenase